MSFKKIFSKYNIHPNVFALSIVSFLMQFGATLIYSTGNVIIKGTLLSASSFAFSRVISESVATVLKVFSGYFSDFLEDRKIFLLIGNLSVILLKIMFFITTLRGYFSIHFLSILYIVTQILDRIMNSIKDAPRDALLVESIGIENSSFAFSIKKIIGSLGTICGCIVAFVIVKYKLLSYSFLYLLSIIPVIAANIILYKFVKNIQEYEKDESIIEMPENNLEDYSDDFSFQDENELEKMTIIYDADDPEEFNDSDDKIKAVYFQEQIEKRIDINTILLSVLNIISVILCALDCASLESTSLFLQNIGFGSFGFLKILGIYQTFMAIKGAMRTVRFVKKITKISLIHYLTSTGFIFYIAAKVTSILFYEALRGTWFIDLFTKESFIFSLTFYFFTDLLPSSLLGKTNVMNFITFPIISSYLVSHPILWKSKIKGVAFFASVIAFYISNKTRIISDNNIFSNTPSYRKDDNNKWNKVINTFVAFCVGIAISISCMNFWHHVFNYYDSWNGPLGGLITIILWFTLFLLNDYKGNGFIGKISTLTFMIFFFFLSNNYYMPDILSPPYYNTPFLYILSYILFPFYYSKPSVCPMIPFLNYSLILKARNFIKFSSYGWLVILACVTTVIATNLEVKDIKIKKPKQKLLLLILLSSLIAFVKANDTLFFNEAEIIGFHKESTILIFMLLYVSITIFSSLYLYLMNTQRRTKAILIMCSSLFISNILLLSYGTSKFIFLLAIIFIGIFSAGLDPVVIAMISENSPDKFRGTILGLTFSLVGIFSIANGMIISKFGFLKLLKIGCIPLMICIPLAQLL